MVAVLTTETWPDAASAAWPSQWTTAIGNDGVVNQDGSGHGRLSCQSTGTTAYGDYAQLTGITATTDLDITFDLTFPATTNCYLVVELRASGFTTTTTPTNCYYLEIDPARASGASMDIGKVVASVNTHITGFNVFGPAWVAGTAQRIRFQAVGNTVQVKWWVPGASEPSTWAKTVTDSALATATGTVGFQQVSGDTSGAGVRTSLVSNLTVNSSNPPSSGLVNRWRSIDLTLANAASVTTWAPITGSVSWTATTAPTFATAAVNGLPVVRFNGSTQWMSSTMVAINQPVTIFMVYKLNALPGAGVFANMRDDVGTDLALDGSTGKFDIFAQNIDIEFGTPSTTGYHVIGVLYNGASSAARVDGTDQGLGAANPGTHATGTAWTIGRQSSASARFVNFDVAEILVYSTAFAASDFAAVDTYVQDFYGITVSDYPVPNSYVPPTGLTATVISSTEIDLSWSAVTGAKGYDLQRDGVVIATDLTGLSYNDTGLSPSTTYVYDVRSVF